ncbi:MAG TPA: nucleotidyltransferase domain-containing protein [Chitinophagaceae bacterium]|nr:nucleotidyltransferase domain-containing protein [Chitinophagaceae bacterium]
MITNKEIQNLTDTIVEAIQPEKILMFGSYASGIANENSDLDLLVIVKHSDLPKRKRSIALYNLIGSKFSFPKDILVRTQSEIDEWKNVRQAFITSIKNESKVLYER